MKEFSNNEVAEVFKAYPKGLRNRLLFLRELIFELANESEEVGWVEETLKWGQPSYITHQPKSGSTIRIDKLADDQYAIYFHCQTTLVESFREIYGDIFEYQGNRALIFKEKSLLPETALKHCIYLALTYHLRKKRN